MLLTKLRIQPFSHCAVGFTAFTLIWISAWQDFSPLTLTSLSALFSSALFFACLCSKCHPAPLRAGWSPSCCPSCAWSWSSTPAGAGVNAVASLSHRRAPAPRRLTRSTTSPRCWWEARPGRAWGTPGVRGRTPAAPSASGRLRFWMGTSRVWADGDKCNLRWLNPRTSSCGSGKKQMLSLRWMIPECGLSFYIFLWEQD